MLIKQSDSQKDLKANYSSMINNHFEQMRASEKDPVPILKKKFKSPKKDPSGDVLDIVLAYSGVNINESGEPESTNYKDLPKRKITGSQKQYTKVFEKFLTRSNKNMNKRSKEEIQSM